MILPIELSLLKDAVVRYGPNLLKLVEDFTGAKPATVSRWLNSESPPVGEFLLKLRVFLSMIEFAPDGYSTLPRLGKQLAEAIALNALSADEVQAELCYTDKGAILDVVLRGRSMLPDKAFRLEELLKRHSSTIDENREFWHELLRMSNLAAVPENLVQSCELPTPVDVGSDTIGPTEIQEPDPEQTTSRTPPPPVPPVYRTTTHTGPPPWRGDEDDQPLYTGFDSQSKFDSPVTVPAEPPASSLAEHDAVRIALSLVGALEVVLRTINANPKRDELLRAIGYAAGRQQVNSVVTTLLSTL